MQHYRSDTPAGVGVKSVPAGTPLDSGVSQECSDEATNTQQQIEQFRAANEHATRLRSDALIMVWRFDGL